MNDDAEKNIENSFINSTDDFLKKIKAENKNDNYFCSIFCQADSNGNSKKIQFPTQTLSYIGARTHRGKTTALISIAVDSIFQGKKTYFITTEESENQIILRMLKAIIFFEKTSAFKIKENETIDEKVKNALRTEKTKNEFERKVKESFEKLSSWMQNKLFTIIDSHKHKDFQDLTNSLNAIEKKSVVLLDYIQHIRKPNTNGPEYKTIQIASQEICDIAINNDLIIISGAQLNRNGATVTTEEDRFKADLLDASLFRESGDIEQDAHIIIQIGQKILKNGKDRFGYNPSRFYEILKQREHAQDLNRYHIADNSEFSIFQYIELDGKIQFFIEENKKTQKKENVKTIGGKTISDKEMFGE